MNVYRINRPLAGVSTLDRDVFPPERTLFVAVGRCLSLGSAGEVTSSAGTVSGRGDDD